jgi:hypothetical protein
MIWRISSSKPISRIRSASSIMSARRLLKTKPLVFCSFRIVSCSPFSERKGKKTHLKVIQQPSRRRDQQVHTLRELRRLRLTVRSSHHDRESLVVVFAEFLRDAEDLKSEFTGGRDDDGAGSYRTRTKSVRNGGGGKEGKDVPFLGLNISLFNISIAGMRKASVFPLPVFAAPNTSLPARSGGIVLAWTSVIFLNPIPSSAFLVPSLRSREEKSCETGAGAGTAPVIKAMASTGAEEEEEAPAAVAACCNACSASKAVASSAADRFAFFSFFFPV